MATFFVLHSRPIQLSTMKKSSLLLLLFTSSVFFACSNKKDETATSSQKTLSLANIDSSIIPGENFFLFANGKWLDTANIPSTEIRIGASAEMNKITKARIRGILDSLAKANNPAGSAEQKAGDFYASAMDTMAIEKAGYDPAKPYLQEIAAIKNVQDLLKHVAAQCLSNNFTLIENYVGADEKNSNTNIATYNQCGLGLPDRDYYFKTDEATAATVNAYRAYIKKLFELTGDDSAVAAQNMKIVFDLEKQLASSHKTNVELRDPHSNYHKMAVADLDKKMPAIGWTNLLQSTAIKADSVNIAQPAYYEKLNALLTTVPIDNWKTYLRFHFLNSVAPMLSNAFVMANFDYAEKALSGRQKIKERWERMADLTNDNLGDALGQVYVKKYFTEDAKKRMLSLVNNLQTAFEKRISRLDWMSDSTKQKAIEKLHSFIKKIGYPDKWRDYSKVNIDKSKFFENVIACNKNEYAYQSAKVGKPVDKSEWGLSAPTINAYYNPTFNEIVFPAGILQFPMFDDAVDDAMNYGCIGMVIGHEMTHAFDDEGSQYDKEGNLKNWWNKDDYDRFKAKAKQVVDLYNKFTVLDSLHVNGELTQGENIADIGGICIAYDAFKMTKQGSDTIKIDGLTPDQRFFLAYAQCWRSKMKDESLRTMINTNPHTPPMYRVWGPLMNHDAYYIAFNIKKTDKMYLDPSERIRIW